MFSSVLLLLLSLGLILASEVSTPLGRISGTTLTSRLGKTIHSFIGIRYAEAPINDLRFKPPVPVRPWSGTYNATQDGPVCTQPGITPSSEDCLFLNVYTTKLPNGTTNPKRPVIVHLHPGGFYSSTGRSNWAGPQYFMDQDIVLVTLNYRIGSLGFISVGKEAPGNNGLKDQVTALKWVRDNIAGFGGNPECVTLFGYSAGAWSITLHMVSPMSHGLFHRGIISSGSALGHYPLPRNQVDLAKRQARYVGCPDGSVQELMRCLKTIPAEILGDSFFQFAEFGIDPILRWSPVIEQDFGQERFLTDDPVRLIQKGEFQQIPIISGITKDEFGSMAFPLTANETLLEELDNNFEKYAPIAFIYERKTPKSREVSRKVKKFYLGTTKLTQKSRPQLSKIYSDSIVGFPVFRTVDLISTKSTKPVYYYEFGYQGRFSHFYLPESNGTVPYGVVHHDDLIYLFYISPLFPWFDSKFPEGGMVETLSGLWASFARSGTPKAPGGVEWTPYTRKTRKYLEIGEDLVVKEDLHKGRYSFWEKMFPLPGHHDHFD